MGLGQQPRLPIPEICENKQITKTRPAGLSAAGRVFVIGRLCKTPAPALF